MKLLRGLGSLVLLAALYKVACAPPRPHENGPLSSNGSGLGGSSGSLNFPDVPPGLGGFGGGGQEPACGDGPDPGLAFSKRNLLRSIAACTTLRLCEFEGAASLLAERAGQYAKGPDAAALDAHRAAFYRAMLRWARLELFQFGPQASAMKDPHAGQGVRDLIYSWPNVSRCRVEEQLFGKAYESHGFDDLVDVPINARGLFSIEYLSFYEGRDNDCTQFSITNAQDAWNQTNGEDLNALKRDYLAAVSRDVAARATRLRERWDPDGENFSGALEESAPYPDQMTALNIVAHALLYLDKEVKDYKVGAPAGLYENAPVQLPELSFAGGSTLLLQANLAGFRDLFAGCDGHGLGVDDWLSEAGHGDLASDILSDLTAAETFARTFPELSRATPSQLEELHAVIKAITDHLKAELFGQGSPIGLTLPTSVEGDTD